MAGQGLVGGFPGLTCGGSRTAERVSGAASDATTGPATATGTVLLANISHREAPI
jgi:hypothetical protein